MMERASADNPSKASMDGRPFVYDEPRPFLTRLFKLDINGADKPLSGKILSITNSDSAFITFNLSTFAKSIIEDTEQIIEKLGAGTGYDALSYCWGESRETFPLVLSTVSSKLKELEEVVIGNADRDGVLLIQRSLHDFLLSLRRKQYNRFMWIDAICIDQDSSLDKDFQIPLMSYVYEYAECVYIWLGEGSDLELAALRIMPKLQENFTNVKEDEAVNPSNTTSFEIAGLPAPNHEVWRALGSILARPWWTRLETLQEIVVARDDVSFGKSDSEYYAPPTAYFLCGDMEVPWKTIEDFITQVSRLRLEDWIVTGHQGISTDHRHAFDAMMEIRTCRESHGRTGWTVSLSALLLATRRRKATMPIDMVIGQAALLDKPTVKALALKQSLPVEQVFTAFAQHYIRQEPKECLLNHIATSERDFKLPSWIPNFASPPETTSLGSRWLGHYDSTKIQKAQMYHAGFTKTGKWRIPRSKVYYAKFIANSLTGRDSLNDLYSTNNTRQIQLVPDSNSILLSGIELDEIVEVIPCNPGAETAKFLAFNSIQQTTDWDAACLDLARRTLSEEVEGFDMYARTITGNRIVMYSNDATERIFDPHGDVDFVSPYLEFKRFMHAMLQAGGSSAEEGNISADGLRFIKVSERITKRRTFFATKKGRIGIGPSGGMVGDRVVVVFYTPTPYVIRQNTGETTFTMVGEIFIRGLMYGEALQMFDDGQVQESKWIVS